MPVRVKELATGKVAEVPSAVARRGLGTEFELVDPQVRVIAPDGRTGKVPRSHIQQALGAGYKLADEAEVADQKLRNEANTAAGNAIGVAEQFASGVTLGASDLALEAVGVDPAAMRAREEALGAVGTAARLAGEVAPALLTGGGSAATSTAGRAARFLPGVALETAAARLGGSSLAKRGAIEGFGYGVGQTVHESVLGETPLEAEHLLAGGFTGSVLGGGLGKGLDVTGGALSRAATGVSRRVGSGVDAAVAGLGDLAERGSAKLRPGVEKIVTNLQDGVPPSRLIVDAIAKGDNSLFERGLLLNDAPPEVAKRLAGEFAADPQRFRVAMAQGAKLDEDLAVLLRDDLNALQDLTDDVAREVGGAAKYRDIDKHIPAGAREQVLDRTADELFKIHDELEMMARENAGKGHQLYDVGRLDDAQRFVERASVELLEDGKVGHAFEVMDRLKHDLGTIKIWNDAGPNATSGVIKANTRLRGVYDRIKTHLEREDLWGQTAVRQKAVNDAITGDFNAMREFAGENGRGQFGKIWDPQTREVNYSVARRLARQYGRKGPAAGDHLANVLDARIRRLEAYEQHTALTPEAKAKIAEVKARKGKLEAALKERAELAGILDDMNVMRGIQTDNSVSTGAMSNLAPIIGGVAGSVFGPIGTAAGILAGQLARPYTTIRGLAGILNHLDGAASKIDIAAIKTRAALFGEKWTDLALKAGIKIDAGARKVGRAVKRGAKAAGRVTRKGITAGATHADDREETMKRVRQLARDPDALAQALDVPTWDLRQHAPNLERMAAQKILTAAQYLIDQEPKKFTTPFGATVVDPVAEREFAQCYEATMDPIGVLEMLPEGTFTSKHAHALQAVYPEIWNGVRNEVADALITAQGEGKQIPLNVLSSIGIALGLPTDVGLQPSMAAELAMRHSGQMPGLTPPPAQGEAPGTKRPRKARAGDIKRTINTYRTPLERTQVE